MSPAAMKTPGPRAPIRFNRLELAGAFGDLGTDFPLIVGIILASGLDPASALTCRMPMPEKRALPRTDTKHTKATKTRSWTSCQFTVVSSELSPRALNW